MALDKKARAATVKGLEGSIRSAKTLVRGIAKTAKATGDTVTDSVNIGEANNVDINTSTFYPTATANGIGRTIEDLTGFNASYVDITATFKKSDAVDPDKCSISYTEGNPPTITLVVDDCS